jgi:hypothetical protein
MLTEEVLVQKFITIAQERCAKLGDLLQYCHVELVNSYWGCPAKLIQHFVVYSPNVLFTLVDTYKDTLRATAKDIGISDVICMNATRIIRDPASRLKERNPVLWLELHWVAVPTKKSSWHPNQD